jgi:transcriptional regulator with XRE-family HTH domain
LGLNQTEVADLAGTTQRTVSQVEAGRAAGIALYLAIADVLGLERCFAAEARRAQR